MKRHPPIKPHRHINAVSANQRRGPQWHQFIAAMEDERGRIARELHDDIGQQLALYASELRVFHDRVPESEPEVRAAVVRLHQNITTIGENINAISRRLHPSIVAHLGLNAALRSACESFSRAHTIPVSFHSDCDGRSLPPQVALGFFRIAQEALRNIAKHARTSTVLVNLERISGRVRMRIQDFGVGFDVEHPHDSRGLGLFSMQERASMIGVTMKILSAPGQGTVVEVSAPPLSPLNRCASI